MTGSFQRGFSRNLTPERIVAATDAPGHRMYRIKWVGSNITDLVPAPEANARCPELVLRYFEEQISFYSEGGPVVMFHHPTPNYMTSVHVASNTES